MPLDEGVAKRNVRVNSVDIAAPVTAPVDVSGSLEIAEDAVGVTLCDAGRCRDLSDPQIRLLGHGKKDLRMVRQESPGTGW